MIAGDKLVISDKLIILIVFFLEGSLQLFGDLRPKCGLENWAQSWRANCSTQKADVFLAHWDIEVVSGYLICRNHMNHMECHGTTRFFLQSNLLYYLKQPSPPSWKMESRLTAHVEGFFHIFPFFPSHRLFQASLVLDWGGILPFVVRTHWATTHWSEFGVDIMKIQQHVSSSEKMFAVEPQTEDSSTRDRRHPNCWGMWEPTNVSPRITAETPMKIVRPILPSDAIGWFLLFYCLSTFTDFHLFSRDAWNSPSRYTRMVGVTNQPGPSCCCWPWWLWGLGAPGQSHDVTYTYIAITCLYTIETII